MNDETVKFINGYLECLAWLCDIERDDVSYKTITEAVSECKDFLFGEGGAEHLIVEALDLSLHFSSVDDYDWASAGHDFYLTRNGHGTGYWDRGLAHVGKELTERAHMYHETFYDEEMARFGDE